jgi:hypothetical protein
MRGGFLRWLLVRCLATALVVAVGLPGLARAQNFGPLDGTWEGELTTVDASQPDRHDRNWRRIVIKDYQAHVFYRDKGGQIVEVKPGKFQAQKLLTNAVIAAIDTGTDNEGRWVESWVFAVTQKDPRTLMVRFARVVNNINLPLTIGHSKFGALAEGEMVRQ